MGYRIKEVSDMSGISIRMLRHYDKTGLLKPDGVLENGYRDYSRGNLDKLQRIKFLKELDFSIHDMIRILEGSENDVTEALRGQEQLLLEKKERLESIIALIRKNIGENGGDIMNDMKKFTAFDMKKIEEHKKKYADEVEKEYGGTEAYEQSKAMTKKYTEADWKRISTDANAIYSNFIAAMKEGPSSPNAKASAKEWKEHISRYYYECTDEIFLGLAEIYVSDTRFIKNIDKHADGLAAFMSAAIKSYISK